MGASIVSSQYFHHSSLTFTLQVQSLSAKQFSRCIVQRGFLTHSAIMANRPTLVPPPPINPSKSAIENVLELTELAAIAPDIFSNTRPLWHPPGARGIYGGAVIAQCLAAAQSTVPSSSQATPRSQSCTMSSMFERVSHSQHEPCRQGKEGRLYLRRHFHLCGRIVEARSRSSMLCLCRKRCNCQMKTVQITKQTG